MRRRSEAAQALVRQSLARSTGWTPITCWPQRLVTAHGAVPQAGAGRLMLLRSRWLRRAWWFCARRSPAPVGTCRLARHAQRHAPPASSATPPLPVARRAGCATTPCHPLRSVSANALSPVGNGAAAHLTARPRRPPAAVCPSRTRAAKPASPAPEPSEPAAPARRSRPRRPRRARRARRAAMQRSRPEIVAGAPESRRSHLSEDPMQMRRHSLPCRCCPVCCWASAPLDPGRLQHPPVAAEAVPFDRAIEAAADALLEQVQPLPDFLRTDRRAVVLDPTLDADSGQQTVATQQLDRVIGERMRQPGSSSSSPSRRPALPPRNT